MGMAGDRVSWTAAATGLALLLSPAPAGAGAFGLRTQSTTALGAAFAGNASGMAGISSMFWNPATITMSPGYTSEYNVSFVAPDVKVAPLSPTPGPALGLGPSGQIGQDAIVPASYTAYQINDTVWIGLNTGSLFGSITKPNDAWAGQAYSRSSRVQSLSFTPVLGLKLNEYVSFGVGPTLQYFKVRLNSAAGAAPTSRSVLLEGDDWSPGFVAGITLKPFEGTTVGLGYRSAIRHEVEGTFRVPLGAATTVVTPVGVHVNLPEQLTFGVTQQITPDLKLSLGYEWMNWSRLGAPAIVAIENGNAPLRAFPLNYKDGHLYSVGGEYQLNERLAVRAGIAYERSPIDNANRSTRLPDTDRIYASFGASYAWSEKLTISGAYSHVFGVGDSAVRIAPGNPQYVGLPFYADTKAAVDILSVSLRYRWDDPRAAIPAAIVTR